jgi:hypothetical protein
MEVCKSDCERTFAGTRGNGEVAPIVLKKSVAAQERPGSGIIIAPTNQA